MLGIMHLQFPELAEKGLSMEEKSKQLESKRRLVYMTADNMALSLVSLKLHEDGGLPEVSVAITVMA